MKIKSMDELKKIKNDYKHRIQLRSEEGSGKGIEILVGMATCGISSGARETLNEFIEELRKEGIDDAKVISVGCIGYCHSEPTVQVNISGQKPVLYGNVTKNKVHEIVTKHLKKGQLINELMLEIDFEKA